VPPFIAQSLFFCFGYDSLIIVFCQKGKAGKDMKITPKEARAIAEAKIANGQRNTRGRVTDYQQKLTKWLQKKFPGKMKSVFKQIKKAAERGQISTDILLTDGEFDSALFDLVIKRLGELGYTVYYREHEDMGKGVYIPENGLGGGYFVYPKVRTYFVGWAQAI
jgi:hypothetical protein